MTLQPVNYPATVQDIKLLPSKGPWRTKSDGELSVLFSIDYTVLKSKFFTYEQSELNKIHYDVRGLRSYRVNGLKKGVIGANEWHRLRNELVFVVRGSIKWTAEDINRERSEAILNMTQGIWVPPFILHTYEALEDDTEILVIANTLFVPEDSTTHDSFSIPEFKDLQDKYNIQKVGSTLSL